jgi:hypothetical protein
MPALSVRRPRALAFAAAGVLALGLSGCSGSSGASGAPAAHTGAAASPAGGSSGGGSYTDSGAVISALKGAGQACTPVSDSGSTSLSAPGLRSISACSLGASAGGTVTASVFDDHADAEAYADLLTSAQDSGLLIGSTSTRAVLGQNWVVVVDSAASASRLSSALGGTVVGGSKSAG